MDVIDCNIVMAILVFMVKLLEILFDPYSQSL